MYEYLQAYGLEELINNLDKKDRELSILGLDIKVVGFFIWHGAIITIYTTEP